MTSSAAVIPTVLNDRSDGAGRASRLDVRLRLQLDGRTDRRTRREPARPTPSPAVTADVSEAQLVDRREFGAAWQVPLSRRALAALDAIPPRLDTPLLFPAPAGGLLNLDNFRRREWAPAVEASGVARPARIYDLRSTFASNALAAGVAVFELARIMGTSGRMIERHYGALLDGAGAAIAERLDALEAVLERDAEAGSGDVLGHLMGTSLACASVRE